MARSITDLDIMEVKIYCTGVNQVALNIRHWLCDFATAGGLTETQWANLLSQDLADVYRPVLSSLCRYEGIRVQKARPLPVTDAIISTTGSGAGQRDDADLLPSQDCGAITLLSGLAGRSFRGRMYIPFPTLGDANSVGHPTGAYKTLISDIGGYHAGNHVYTVGGQSVQMSSVVFNRVSGGITRVVNHNERDYFTTQRRRSQASHPDGALILV